MASLWKFLERGSPRRWQAGRLAGAFHLYILSCDRRIWRIKSLPRRYSEDINNPAPRGLKETVNLQMFWKKNLFILWNTTFLSVSQKKMFTALYLHFLLLFVSKRYPCIICGSGSSGSSGIPLLPLATPAGRVSMISNHTRQVLRAHWQRCAVCTRCSVHCARNTGCGQGSTAEDALLSRTEFG